jgi:excisionase family DNA binding protein
MTGRLEVALHELVAALREELHTEAEARPPAPDRLLSISEAAAVLGVGRTLAYGLIGRGDLRTLKVGRRRLVPTEAIATYIDARKRLL